MVKNGTESIFGQSMFEIIFVIAITALILTGVVSLSTVAVRNTNTSSNQGISPRYLREAVDFLRSERDKSWSTFYLKSAVSPGITYCIKDLSAWPTAGACGTTDFISGTNNLKREVVLVSEASNKVKAKITITWNDSQGVHEEVINTVFVNWNEGAF